MYRVNKRAFQGLVKASLLRFCFDNPNQKITTSDFLKFIEDKSGYHNWSGIRRHLKFLVENKLLVHHIDKKDAKQNYYSLPDDYLSKKYADRIIENLGLGMFLGFKQYFSRDILNRYSKETKRSIIEQWQIHLSGEKKSAYFYINRAFKNLEKVKEERVFKNLDSEKKEEMNNLNDIAIKILDLMNREIEIQAGIRDFDDKGLGKQRNEIEILIRDFDKKSLKN
jgi:hypothetical protein